MIKINKGQAPQQLLIDGDALKTQMIIDFDANENDYISSTKKFKFDNTYKSNVVRLLLRLCQNDKCCFSEAKFEGDYKHVEHFRPKGRVDNMDNTSHYPGYFWLAYEWSNLFLCKQLINVSYKRNFFPLEANSNRNLKHSDNNVEYSTLIDPSMDDPRDHIRFHKDEIIALSERGRQTIELLGLRHSDFEEGRRRVFGYLQTMKDTIDIAIDSGIDIGDPRLQQILKRLRASILPNAPYSSMAIDFLSGWPHLV